MHRVIRVGHHAHEENTVSNNHFSGLHQQLQKAPQSQRVQALINGIATQMEQIPESDNTTIQQLAEELQNVKTQLAQSCQQGEHVAA